MHVILCLNEREIQKKNKNKKKRKGKERKIIGQKDQMLELNFDFPLSTFNLSFSKMNSPCSLKVKEKEQKKKVKRGERKERKTFV